MKKNIYFIACALLIGGYSFAQTNEANNTKQLQKLYKEFEKNSKTRNKMLKKGGIPPNAYNDQDYLNTLDPMTGKTYFDKVISLRNDLNAGMYHSSQPLNILGGSTSATGKFNQDPWLERGPYNVGGRTLALMYDPNDATGKRVFAGGASGGLWVNQDPSVATNQWTPISDFWANMSISCITSDPNNPQTFYVGTGEVETGDASGAGIWKSTDGGTTWTQIFTIPATYTGIYRNGNLYVTDIKVRNNNGTSEVYAGVAAGYVGWSFVDGQGGIYQAGLYKSTNGGATFTKNTGLVTTTSNLGYCIQQIQIDAANNVWVSTRGSGFSNVDSGGRIFSSADGNTFTLKYNAALQNSRVKIGVSKTNTQKVYALMEGSGTSEPVRILKTTDGGTSWVSTNSSSSLTLPADADTGIPANDFTRGQAFYDLVIETDPQNDETVYVGGIDLFKSTNGGSSWSQISKWSNNNNLANLQVSSVHADQHALVFNPFNNYATNQMMFGNDGGIYFAANKNSLGTTGIGARNTRYNVTQYYSATLNPTGTNTITDEEIIAGAQDNGSHWLDSPVTTANFLTSSTAASGDGMMTEFDDQGNYAIASYVNNNHYVFNSNGSFYILSSANRNYGYFVNELALDRANDIIYTYRNAFNVFRTPNLTGTSFVNTQVSFGTPQANELISKMRVSPYTTTSTTLFFGTNLGRMFKVTNANIGTTPTTTALTTLPNAGTVSDIRFGANENQILVTLSNYNVTSVFYSADGGVTWQNKEGNLPDMPVRAIFMNPDDNNEVLVGTEAGVWATQNFSATTPTWAQYSNGIGNVKITGFDYRPSTKTLLVSTYGRGAWTNQNVTTPLSTSETAVNKFHTALYPNPTRGNVALRFDTSKYNTVDITVFDTAGRLVFTKNGVKSDEEFNTGLKNGNYVLKASDKGQQVFTSFLQIGKKNSDD